MSGNVVRFVSGNMPVVCAQDTKNNKFVMEGGLSMDALQEFVEDCTADKLEPYLKSEPMPQTNDGPVAVAVSKKLDNVVTNNGKDTLIEFYAPSCGHCMKLAPIFDELGIKMEDEDVAIVKMDATANDVPSAFEVRGFPTLFWLPRDGKSEPQLYEGGRELNDFVRYLAKHATSELEGWDHAGKVKKTRGLSAAERGAAGDRRVRHDTACDRGAAGPGRSFCPIWRPPSHTCCAQCADASLTVFCFGRCLL